MFDLLALLTKLWLDGGGGGAHTNDGGGGGGSDKAGNLGGPGSEATEDRPHLDTLAARITTNTLR